MSNQGGTMFDQRFETLDDFARAVAKMAEQVGQGFDRPEDDWAPVAIAIDSVGQAWVDLLPLTDPASKNFVFGQMLPNAIREKQIERIALVISSWAVVTESDSEAMDSAETGITAVPKHRREEALMITAHEDGASFTLMTKIIRFPDQPPLIGAWSELDNDEMLFDRHTATIQSALSEVN